MLSCDLSECRWPSAGTAEVSPEEQASQADLKFLPMRRERNRNQSKSLRCFILNPPGLIEEKKKIAPSFDNLNIKHCEI